jgi:hypothetical protein
MRVPVIISKPASYGRTITYLADPEPNKKAPAKEPGLKVWETKLDQRANQNTPPVTASRQVKPGLWITQKGPP